VGVMCIHVDTTWEEGRGELSHCAIAFTWHDFHACASGAYATDMGILRDGSRKLAQCGFA
jgi:hypothetical protein